MKYRNEPVVSAIYEGGQLYEMPSNPFQEAMPELLSKEDFFARIRCLPPPPHNLSNTDATIRRSQLISLQTLFYPMDYMYTIYDSLYRSIATAYSSKTVLDTVRQINASHINLKAGRGYQDIYATQPESSSILGVPGIGKTSTIRRCLNLIPQVIVHTRYKEIAFYTKQITHLIVECPSDCSIKTLVYHIAKAVDRAIGSEYFDRMSRVKSMSASALATQIKIICLNHHVGLIVVDEIQNVILTAEKSRQVKPLIRFLVELTNDTGTSICFVGTPIVEKLFCSQEHLKRRTRGPRLLPLAPGGVYREFLEVLWDYQFTVFKTKLTDKLANQFYDWSGGIPAYLVKLFSEAQVQAILTGKERLGNDMLKLAAERLSIQIPKVFAQGTHISAFSVESDIIDEAESNVLPEIVEKPTENEMTPRLYANIRGRKKTARDRADLLELLKKVKTVEGMISAIEQLNMKEGDI